MGRRLSRLTRYNVLVGALLVLLIPFGIPYIVYVAGQVSYFSSRSLRLLDTMSNQVESHVESLKNVLVNAASDADDTSSASDVVKISESVRAKVEAAFANALIDGTKIELREISPADIKRGVRTVPQVSVARVTNENGAFWIYLSYTGSPDTKSPSYSVSLTARSNLDELLKPFASRLTDSTLGRNEFDAVVIARADPNGEQDGTVIFQLAQSGLSLTSLKTLIDESPDGTNRDGRKIDFKTFTESSGLINVRLAGGRYRLFTQPVEFSLLRQDTGRPEKWIVGGLIDAGNFQRKSWDISYTIPIIFTFLLSLVVLSLPLLRMWFIGPKDRLRMKHAYYAAFSVLGVSSLITFLLLYGYTYFYLEKRTDYQLENLAHDIQTNLREEVKSSLRQIEEFNATATTPGLELTNSFTKRPEKRTLQDLDAADEGGAPNGAELRYRPEELEIRNLLERAAGRSDSRQLLDPTPHLDLNSPYPYFSTMFWIDQTGRQRIKWTVRRHVTRHIRVDKRSYFREAIKGDRLWTIRAGEDGPLPSFRLESIQSLNTGGSRAVVSTRVASARPLEAPWVAAFDTHLLSLINPVLPAGFGYCVIDDKGLALFHSDEVQNLQENFFEESDKNRLLRSLVLGRAADHLNARYMGRSYRLFVLPLEDFPAWSLIVFRDKNVLGTVVLELLTTAMILFTLYLVVMLAVFALLYFLNLHDHNLWVMWHRHVTRKNVGRIYTRRFAWVSPDQTLIVSYWLALLTNFSLAGLFAAAIVGLHGWRVVGLAVLIPVAATMLIYLNLKSRSAETWRAGVEFFEQSDFFNYRRGYLLTVATTLVVISVLPSVAFFKVAYDHGMQLFVKHAQINLARQHEQRAERVKAQYTNVTIGENNSLNKHFVERRLKSEWDVYEKFFFGTTHTTSETFGSDRHPAAAGDATETGFEQFVGEIRPLYNQISVEMRGLVGLSSADNLWRWERREPERKLILHTPMSGSDRGAGGFLRIESSIVPSFGSREFLLWWKPYPVWEVCLAMAALLALALLVLLVRFVVQHVFLLKFDDAASSSDADWATKPITQNLLVLGSSSEQKEKLTGRRLTDAEYIDVRKVVSSSDGGQHQAAGKDFVIVDHFEYKIGDPAANRRKLRLLEELLIDARPIVIVSAVDPASCSLNGGGAAGNDEDAADGAVLPHPRSEISQAARLDAERWAEVLGSFLRVYIEERSFTINNRSSRKDRRAFIGAIDEIIGLLEREPKRARNRLMILFQVVKDECQPRGYLREIGAAIITRMARQVGGEIGAQIELKIDDWYDEKAAFETPGACPAGGELNKRKLLSLPHHRQLNHEKLIHVVEELAHTCYSAIWATCTKNEKLALLHLAQDHLISSKNHEIRRLLRRGLIVRDPTLRLMNESFRSFVISACRPETIVAWEQEGERSNWQVLKVPLLVILVIVTSFLFITHRELYDSSLAIITAITAGIPALLKLLSLLQINRTGSQTQN